MKQQFDSFDDWVNTATRKLATHERNGKWHLVARTPDEKDRAICFDAKGRRCWIGKDFARARDENAFPVKYIWPDQIPALLELAEEAYKGDNFDQWLSEQGEK